MKAEEDLGRCFLKGREGDAADVIRTATLSRTYKPAP